MPTNLPAEARHKWSEVSSARTPQEKIRALQEFLSLVPKHKGTAKLCAHVKHQIAILRREIKTKKSKRGRSRPSIDRKGAAAQIVILGPTNVGRSSLLASLTNARVKISNLPFTTQEPAIGTLQYEDLKFQMVEAPALDGDRVVDALGLGPLSLAREADSLILMVDLSNDPCKQLSLLLERLEEAGILALKPQGYVHIERSHTGLGIRVFILGKLVDCSLKDVENLLRSYRIFDCVVKIYGNVTLDDVENAIFKSSVYRPAIIIANKLDSPQAEEKLRELESFVKGRIPIIPVSCKNKVGLNKIGAEIFKVLDIIRVYTKEPGNKEFSKTPFVLKRGMTILDLAKQIHTELYERFAYAKVWSKRLPFTPQKVGSSFTLEDGDIVEIHVKRGRGLPRR